MEILVRRFIKLLFIAIIFNACSSGGSDGGDEEPEKKIPGPVTLSEPANNEPCFQGVDKNETQKEVTFKWLAAENAETYDMFVTNLETNQTTTTTSIEGTSSAVLLVKGTPYSWRVISKSSSTGQTGTSATWKMYLAGEGEVNYAPFPAEIVSPSKGASVSRVGGEVTLEWDASDIDNDPLTYTVYLDKVDGKQTPIAALTDLSVKTVDVSVDAGSAYYWRIKTSDALNSSFSSVYTFTTE